MKIHICRKSITDLKNPVIKNEYETNAVTVEDFICEMVEKNYRYKPVKDSLKECQSLAVSEFADGSYYIVNHTKHTRYASLGQKLETDENDEIVLIKLKYVRGMVW